VSKRISASTLLLAAALGGTHLARADGRHELSAAATFPLKVSANKRYLVDQRNVPFLIVGDSPQSMIGNLSLGDAGAFIANRKAAGFNALWINLLCASYTGCRGDGKTYDGIPPFVTQGDLSKPNPAYFSRVDDVIGLAAKAGMVVFLDPIETGGWLPALRRNGVAKDRAYGAFLGRRYKSFPNIVWMSGNDFQSWQNVADDAAVLAVAEGIRSTDPRHLQTVELNYTRSSSLDDARWRGHINLNAAYTYNPTYAEVQKDYTMKRPLPVFMVEAGYEFEQNSQSFSPGSPEILRRQEYWSILSGATGAFYGNHYTWQFANGWRDHLDTAGSAQMGYAAKLFTQTRWFALVPDVHHNVVTAGYGKFSDDGNVGSSAYVTTAATRDRRLAISYIPGGATRTVTVDTLRIKGKVTARWLDPTNGTYSSAGSSIRKSRAVHFTTPGKNSAGDRDWVLVLAGR
jgi:hypothetical protein